MKLFKFLKSTKFWLAWCAAFFLFDVVAGAVYLARGEWGWAIYEFVLAGVMAFFLRLYLRDYREERRERAQRAELYRQAWEQTLERF